MSISSSTQDAASLVDAANPLSPSPAFSRSSGLVPASIASDLDTPASAPARRPKVRIFGTGGTIASRAASNIETANYAVGMSIENLVDAIPALTDIADVSFLQFANAASKDLTDDHLLDLVSLVENTLRDDSGDGIDGVVITHGTDTIEETAFLLALTLRTDKPVVLVGAMRPATAISADGPMNLLQAVALAGSPAAAGRGPMIVLSDRIGSAFYTTKRHANQAAAFDGGEAGYLGYFIGVRPHFFFTPARPTGSNVLEKRGASGADALQALPRVDVLYGYQGMPIDLLHASIAAGAAGVVLANVGNGSTPNDWKEEVAALMARGIPMVRATRTGGGHVTPRAEGIAAGRLNPQKARILLRLLLASGATLQQIQTAFEQA